MTKEGFPGRSHLKERLTAELRGPAEVVKQVPVQGRLGNHRRAGGVSPGVQAADRRTAEDAREQRPALSAAEGRARLIGHGFEERHPGVQVRRVPGSMRGRSSVNVCKSCAGEGLYRGERAHEAGHHAENGVLVAARTRA